MNWMIQTLWSSIGKKLLMALTGLAFCGFLAGHLAGNLTIYGGKDAFNSYAEHLHALGPVLTLMEWGLLVFAVVHVCAGLTLFYQNFRARTSRYAVNKWAGGRTIGSATMPYTGILLLTFIILHLINFHFVDKTNTTIYQIVAQTFENPLLCRHLYPGNDCRSRACQPRFMECLPDNRRQPHKIYAVYHGLEYYFQPGCWIRFWYYSDLFIVCGIERKNHAA